MANYSWAIQQIKIAKQLEQRPNVIVSCNYRLTASIDGLDEQHYFDGVQDLQLDLSNFVNFEKVTEKMAIDWVKQQINPAFLENVKKELEGRFQQQTIEFEVIENPWE